MLPSTWEETTHLRAVPTIEFHGQTFVVVVIGQIMPDTSIATLRVKHQRLNTMTSSDFEDWGFSPEDLKQKLEQNGEDEEQNPRRKVVEGVHSLWPAKKGKQYYWIPEVHRLPDGTVNITVRVGCLCGEEVDAFSL